MGASRASFQRGRKRRVSVNGGKDDASALSKLVKNDEKEFYQRKEALEKENELLQANVSQVQIARFPFLRYEGDEATCAVLEQEFHLINAIRFRTVLKAICIVGVVWFSLYLPVLNFLSAGGLDSQPETRVFYIAIIFVFPCIYFFLSSNLYLKHTQSSMFIMFLSSGILFVLHKLMIRDFSNMVLSLYVILLFTATPLVLINAAIVAGTVILLFFTVGIIGLNEEHLGFIRAFEDAISGQDDTVSTLAPTLAPTVLHALMPSVSPTSAPPGSDSETESLGLQDMLLLGGTNVFAFFFLVYVTYYRELNLRKAVVSHHILLAKASEVENEVDKTHNLLRSMLPDVIAEQLRRREDEDGPLRIAEKFGSVTVMFVEVCNFNKISSEQTQDEVLDILNTVYSVFDSILEDYDVHKVETVGQVYLVVGGCPNRSKRHGEDIGELALEFLSVVPEINEILRKTVPNLKQQIQVRIGLNTGSIVAGVVGQRSPRYKLFGDPVNTASRMQSTCPDGKIQCSSSTYRALVEKFIMEHRGSITVKGKGEMDTYFLVGRRDTIDQGRNAIRNKNEMQQHVALLTSNFLFRSFAALGNNTDSVDSSVPSSSSSSGRRYSKSKVLPAPEALNERKSGADDPEKSYSQDDSNNISSIHADSFSGGFGFTEDKRSKSGFRKYLKLLTMVFSIGTPQFRTFLYARGLQNVLKFANLLLFLLPVALVATLILMVLVSSVNGLANITVISLIVMFLICGIISFMSKNRKLHQYLYIVVELAFICVTGSLVVMNVVSAHPNASFLMVVITFFFNLQLIPMLHRFILANLASLVNCGALLVSLSSGSGKYSRYTTIEKEREVDASDILLHFVLLTVSILLQLWCVVIQDLFLYQDFCHNKMIMDQNRKLQTQKAQTTALLSQLLPPTIVPKLVETGDSQRIVDRFDNVTILFTDMVNFTSFSQKISPLHLMDFLNVMYTRFDAITEKYKLYKVEVIGDAYFIVGGCPVVSEDHTERVVKAAHEMLSVLPELCQVAHRILKAQHKLNKEKSEREKKLRRISRDGSMLRFSSDVDIPEHAVISEDNSVPRRLSNESVVPQQEYEDEEIPVPDISIRIGIHVGSVIAGVVGFKDPRYHIFGDAVSLANMMESKGKPGKVHVSQSTVDALMKGPGIQNVFQVEPREPIDLSPVAEPQQTYFLSYK